MIARNPEDLLHASARRGGRHRPGCGFGLALVLRNVSLPRQHREGVVREVIPLSAVAHIAHSCRCGLVHCRRRIPLNEALWMGSVLDNVRAERHVQ